MHHKAFGGQAVRTEPNGGAHSTPIIDPIVGFKGQEGKDGGEEQIAMQLSLLHEVRN